MFINILESKNVMFINILEGQNVLFINILENYITKSRQTQAKIRPSADFLEQSQALDGENPEEHRQAGEG